MKTAVKVKEFQGWAGEAAKYRLSEPYDGSEYVIVSAAYTIDHGPETYIFPADEDGEDVTSWLEMEGSFRGGLDHARALRNAGYEIVEP